MRTKMIQLAEIIRTINTQIEVENDESAKKALCELASTLLFAHGKYNGYMYTFWTSASFDKYGNVQNAIADGVGCEYDRYYFYLHI